MTRSIDEIREELTSGACISFLEKLERLEGDVMIHLSEEYRDCILSHQVVAPVSTEQESKTSTGMNFWFLYLRVRENLRRIALRRIQVL